MVDNLVITSHKIYRTWWTIRMHITPLQGNNSKFSPTTVGNLDIYFAISGEERNIFSNHGGQFGCILLSYFRGTTIKVFSNRGGLFGGTNTISEKIFQTLWIIWMHIEPFQRRRFISLNFKYSFSP